MAHHHICDLCKSGILSGPVGALFIPKTPEQLQEEVAANGPFSPVESHRRFDVCASCAYLLEAIAQSHARTFGL